MQRAITLLFHTFGWTLSRAPVLARPVAALMGEVLYLCMPRRRRTTLSNLDHAFPERGKAWARSTARASFRRMVETGLFTAALPYLSEASLRRRFEMPEATLKNIREVRASGAGAAIAIPHLALWEALSLTPLLSDESGVRFGTVYRPQKLEAVESWIRQSRGRFGLELFSRRSGLLAPARFVSSGGFLGVLIDQNAGDLGTLDLFLGRLASCTTLHGILAERARGVALFAWPERTGFWKARLRFERLELPPGADENAVVRASNDRLARLLAEDPAACTAWLWSHNRWRCQDAPAQRFAIKTKRSLVHGETPLRSVSPFPRKTRMLVLCGGGEAEGRELAHLFPRLRAARQDLEVTLAGSADVLAQVAGAADAAHAVSEGNFASLAKTWRERHFDTALVLDAPSTAKAALRSAQVRQVLGVCADEDHVRVGADEAPVRVPAIGAAGRWTAVFEALGLPKAGT